MKILYSHRTRAADGQLVHITSLVKALRDRSHEVFVVGPEGAGAAERAMNASPQGGLIKRFAPKALYEAAEIGYSAHAYRRLRKVAEAASPDLIYERYNLFFGAGARLAKAAGLPFILEVNAPLAAERAAHGGLALKKQAFESETDLWRAADAILPVTNVLAKTIEARGIQPEKIMVIPNGVDDAFLTIGDGDSVRARYGLENKIVLGFAGFMREWHGLERVVDWMAKAPEKSLHLFLVGDGPARSMLEERAAAAGLTSALTVTGAVQRAQMPDHIAAFDIALQPAAVDYASPLKLFEYMAQARAIVAPSQPNIEEVLKADEAALFDPLQSNGLEAALSRLVNAPDLRRKLGASARAALDAQDLTWASNARRVEEIARGLQSGLAL